MADISVVGGLYWERCLFPLREDLYGSGGRAACILAGLGHTVEFQTAADSDAVRRFQAHANSITGIACSFVSIERSVRFSYSHPLAPPTIDPPKISDAKPHIEASGNAILCYGMLDAKISVRGEKVVYDPQSPTSPSSFRTIGEANQLVVIVNETEAIGLSGEATLDQALITIASEEGADAVIVKRGPRGCLLWTPDGIVEQACYRTSRIYKIGSGDVFSAVFFREWALGGSDILDATVAAARATAVYCEAGEVLALKAGSYDEAARRWAPSEVIEDHKGVYLAGPFFTTAERWLVAEAHRTLEEFNLEVFSPFHDVGLGKPEEVVVQDLKGLDSSSVVLALLDGADPGTIFEIGHARSRNIDVVILAENFPPKALTMFKGSGCEIYTDLAAALYACCWK